MSTDTGPRKRNKDKKRKKGSVGEGDTAVTIPRDIPAMKLIADETIHVQKEVDVGGNVLSKLIFVCLFLLLGLSLVFIWTEYNGFNGEGTGTQVPWLTQFLNFSFFPSQRPEEEPVSTADSEPEAYDQNFFQQWLDFWPFSSERSVDTDLFGDLKKDDAENDSKDDTSDAGDDTYEQDHSDDNDDDQGEDADDQEPEETNKLDDLNEEEDEPDNDDNDEDDSVPLNVNRRDYDGDSYGNKYKFNYRAMDDSKVDRFDEFDYGNDDYPDRDRNDDLDENDESEEEKEEVDEKEDDSREDDDDDDAEGNDDRNERDDDDEDEQDELEDTDDQKELESNIPSDAEERRDDASENKTEEETTTTNVVTKLGVGVALIIVAYTVVIRKWNNYANLLDQVFEEVAEQDQPEEQIDDQYAFNDENPYQENRTLQEYLETPTASESEDSKAENARWSTSGADILAQEVGDSDSVTSESEPNDSDIEPSATFDRYVTQGYDKANITNQYDWQHREDLDDADEDFDGGDYRT